MPRRTMLVVGTLLLGAPLLIAQVPPEERIPITDADRLEALGFPRDAKNVYVWSKADLNGKRAQDAENFGPSTTETFGTNPGYSSALGFELEGESPNQKWLINGFDAYCDFDSPWDQAVTRIHVLEGSVLRFFRWWAYDDLLGDDLSFTVYEACQPPDGAGPTTNTVIGQAKTSGSTGNQSGYVSLGALTANNQACAYMVRVDFSIEGSACRGLGLKVQKMRFQWSRQVSPAPAVASFTDVPTSHPYFRHIEALFDSGISAGCSPTMYCPAKPITRGEMAVFLAKALGLNWP